MLLQKSSRHIKSTIRAVAVFASSFVVSAVGAVQCTGDRVACAAGAVDVGSSLQVLWDDHVVDTALSWESLFSKGRAVAVEFDMSDADLYSFRFR